MRLAGQYGLLKRSLKRPLNGAILNFSQHFSTTTAISRQTFTPIQPISIRESPNPRAGSIGVLGGGISGLATAYHISQTIPNAKITIYEKEDEFGGWLDSETVEVDGGEVVFEWGPRNLRPDAAGPGRSTLTLLTELELLPEVIGVSKRHPAATNRYIYYPDRLVRMPGPDPNAGPLINMIRSLYTALTEPVFNGVIRGVLSEPTLKQRPSNLADESVGDFVRRRFGAATADNLVSALFHGIYAGDIYKLSARTLLPGAWYMETRDSEGNGIIAEAADLVFRGQSLRPFKDIYLNDLSIASSEILNTTDVDQRVLSSLEREVSVYTFAAGLSVLRNRLIEVLRGEDKVEFRMGANVACLDFDRESKKVAVTCEGESAAQQHDYVVSTLSPHHLSRSFKKPSHDSSTAVSPRLEQALVKSSEAVTVMVVNLYYSNPDLLEAQGFGYLIPQSVDLDQNPERALGVIFGSQTSGMRGEMAKQVLDPNEPAEKTSVMLQGMIDGLQKRVATPEKDDDPELLKKDIAELQASMAAALKWEQSHAGRSVAREIRTGQDTAPGTKLTVMIGGHWWDGWAESELPNEEQGIDMAMSVLARHLKVAEAPTMAKARLQKNCIPQYRVGYRQRMATIHSALLDEFEGRVKMVGPWWQGGVGVNNCTQNARLVTYAIREQWDDKTGLEDYAEPEKFVLYDRSTDTHVIDQSS